ncbi:MAG: efflux RND transporter permease subunit [Eubacterium sp.]|nr:efflux RND transporter permease subunit [Eubacterium sp.]
MISKYSVKRPYTVFVCVIAVIVIGVVALMRMTPDLLPDMDLPYVVVVTTDMGASPETVEREVTAPIEASLATTSNLKNIHSMSYNSYSTVVLEYEQGANMDATLIEIQQSLDQVKGKFSDDIGTPMVMQLDPDMLPVMVSAVSVDGMKDAKLTDYVESDIIPQLESIEGVASVSSSGGITESVQVVLSQDKIDKLNKKIDKAIEDKFKESRDELNENKEKLEEALQMAQAYGSAAVGMDAETISAQLAEIESGLNQLDDTKEAMKESLDLNNVLALDNLNGLLKAQNFDMPAGYISDKSGKFLVKVGDNLSDTDDLKKTVLIDLGMEDIDPIRVDDVADVINTDDSDKVYAKLNNEPGMLISFQKQTGHSTAEVTDSILAKFESLEKSESENLHFSVLMNQGIYIDVLVKSIIQNILVGAALAILVLLIFLRDVRPTIIIACAIPLSLISAIVLMYFAGITLNVISMSGLTLGIGMLVDNSIVVIENIFRLRRGGESIKKASVYGAGQVAGAIVASTLTTMCVFLPIVFTEGLTRQLFVDMGLTIAFTLTASLLVALTLVPAMAQGLLRKVKEREEKTDGRFMAWYEGVLKNALKHKGLVFVIMLLLMGASVFLAMSRGTEFMPQIQTDQLTVTLKPEKGNEKTFEEMTACGDEMIEVLQGIPEVETIGTMMGNGSSLGALTGESDGSISMYVILDENANISNEAITDKIMKASSDIDCEVEVSTELMDMSVLTGDGISVMIKGRDIQTLQDLATQIADKMETVEGIDKVDNGLENMTKTFVITVDKEKAAEYGMTVAQVFARVSEELASTTATTSIETDIKDYEVFVETDEQADLSLADLKNLKFEYTDKETQEKKEKRLSEIVTFTEDEELSQVLRDSQSRYISVSASIKDDHNIGLVGNEVQKKLNELDVPEGYTVSMTGENETINDAMRQVLLMMLLAVILIYLIMVAQFQSLKSPFIIMFTIPLAFTGGFMALYLSGKAVSVISLIGFVMLAGIIVNNGIVLVDYVNQLRRGGMSKKDAIVDSAKTRLRPVLMTALTTIISMSTMAIGMGRGVEMSQPMAIVVVGGMVYGTLLTLIVVPCLYDAFNKERDMREEEL